MPRSVEEWRGKTDDSAIPPRVSLRVLEAHNRICWICGNPIRPGDGTDIHHKRPLADGGEHRETNLAPVHRRCHRLLTAKEALARAETRATVTHHYGLKQPKRPSFPTNRNGPFKQTFSRGVVRREPT